MVVPAARITSSPFLWTATRLAPSKGNARTIGSGGGHSTAIPFSSGARDSRSLHFPLKQRLCEPPVSQHCLRRDFKNLGDFINAESSEKAELDDLTLAR